MEGGKSETERALRANRTARRGAIAWLSATALMVSGLSAQTAIYNALGSSGSGPTIYDVGPSSAYWEATSFLYAGPTGATLFSVLFQGENLYDNPASELDISFKEGTSIGTATTLESWSLPGSSSLTDQTYTLNSTLAVGLVSGDTYWVELSSPYYGWVWDNTSSGAEGNTYSTDGGATWSVYCTACGTGAYEVFATESGDADVATEPATMTLLAVGLVGISGAGVRRRRTRSLT